MTKAELKQVIRECCNDVLFTYNRKSSGITSEVREYAPTFQVWHGSDIKEYSDVDELMKDKFFSGKSITDLLEEVEFTFA